MRSLLLLFLFPLLLSAQDVSFQQGSDGAMRNCRNPNIFWTSFSAGFFGGHIGVAFPFVKTFRTPAYINYHPADGSDPQYVAGWQKQARKMNRVRLWTGWATGCVLHNAAVCGVLYLSNERRFSRF